MSDAAPPVPQLVTELKVSAHLMQLEAGVYCVYNSPGSALPDATTGLPGARISLPPGQNSDAVSIGGFDNDGWLAAPYGSALIRVTEGPAQIMMTIYQDRNAGHEPPRLQVTKLVEGNAAAAQATPNQGQAAPQPARVAAQPAATPPTEAEVAAHLQVHGDVLGRLGDWIGEPGSQLWVEGFAVSPRNPQIQLSDIEYQAVLGRGWLSPWAEGGQYCGSRGMALPILGLRARLRGKAAEAFTLEINATFTDGTTIGPVGPGEACEAESLAPLEAFCITAVPLVEQRAESAGKRVGPAAAPAPSGRQSTPRARPLAAPPKPQGIAEPNAAPAKPTRGRRS